jgi:hypothetical protein
MSGRWAQVYEDCEDGDQLWVNVDSFSKITMRGVVDGIYYYVFTSGEQEITYRTWTNIQEILRSSNSETVVAAENCWIRYDAHAERHIYKPENVYRSQVIAWQIIDGHAVPVGATNLAGYDSEWVVKHRDQPYYCGDGTRYTSIESWLENLNSYNKHLNEISRGASEKAKSGAAE